MFRFNKDIGLFTLDRGKDTCIYSTAFCRAHCYNNKMYNIFGKRMCGRDIKNEEFWQHAFGEDIYNTLLYKRHSTDRIRLCSRGEPFIDASDVYRIGNWASYMANTKILIFTKAWRNDIIKELIELHLFKYSTLFIFASLDPDTLQNYDQLKESGWRVTFFGDDNFQHNNFIKCPKTWEHKKDYCNKCNYCFNRWNKDIHFKMH